ncbi:hypothetical protein AMAG_02656 [Allomyces macrogynus ATCC 38327]|uniref:Uncharacterized protein n=1 Tax=Allomyces macrogynus (strain ATCC 38327) TaxID=578462 RepID=A0A0L0S391_ALLM3|nr:hypothetical protein AMAG_02656 [Allomyces macrogynus ATCC 38327]|eukprot:KNE56885.1 hypothetical protein AMAG_02656 [Allomyces macrogynus ATCC 38327]
MIPLLWPAHDAPVVVLARSTSSTNSNSDLSAGLATLSLDAATVPAPQALLTTGEDGSVKLWNVDAASATTAESAQALIPPTSNARPPRTVTAVAQSGTRVCSGAVFLPNLQKTKRKSDKAVDTELLTFGIDYLITSWKLVVNSAGAPKMHCLSALDIRTILSSQQQQPTSNTAYNPPLVLSHSVAYTDRAMSARSQMHVLGLGNGFVLFLRARSRQRKSLGRVSFHMPGSAVITTAARALGWEGVETQGAHMYFVEQLSTVPGHPHLVVSACADGSIAVWDVRFVFDSAAPCATASVLVKVSAMAVIGVQGTTVQVAVAGPLLSIDPESAPAKLV